ncbi:GNAT family N-acetyltransferase [Streptomyces sp. NPDC050619]|uniref:GNAT family N-acetyltransferase n=1 Tax=Streptomyces sp. NPDC050619 TaxID=3157214 RepID=UPI0034453864
MVLIRAARTEEAAFLSELALQSKAYWGYDEAFIAACREELTVHESEVEPRRTTVAEADERILGFITLEGEPPEGILGMMFVDPDAIGRGIGRLLFAHNIATARKLGFVRVTIDADPNAEPFYRAMGAVRIGTTPSGSIPGRVLPLMAVTVTDYQAGNHAPAPRSPAR